MNGTVDTTATQHALIRRVDDGVNLERDDVSLENLES